MALDPGSALGHYEIISSLGTGGVGEVYRAKDTKLGREVAVQRRLFDGCQCVEGPRSLRLDISFLGRATRGTPEEMSSS